MCKYVFTGFITIILSVIPFDVATIDLNARQIQFVADHLTSRECHELIPALYKKSFQIDAESLKDDAKDADLPCLVRLLAWDKNARIQTFQKLCLRLREIGRPDIANKLSKSVYHETANAIKKNFLKDPYKKMIPKKSVFLVEPVEEKDYGVIAKTQPLMTPVYIASIVCGSASLAVVVCLCISRCCPGLCLHLYLSFAPVRLVVCCEVCCDEISYRCNRFNKHFKKHVLGETFKRDEQELML